MFYFTANNIYWQKFRTKYILVEVESFIRKAEQIYLEIEPSKGKCLKASLNHFLGRYNKSA